MGSGLRLQKHCREAAAAPCSGAVHVNKNAHWVDDITAFTSSATGSTQVNTCQHHTDPRLTATPGFECRLRSCRAAF